MGKCKTCGKSAESDYCFQHKPRRKMRRGSKLRVFREIEMRDFFMTIWKKRLHKSEVSQLSLGNEPCTGFFHHILEKSKYPELAYIEENIILLNLDEHANVESDIYKYPLINERRIEIINKYLKPREDE